LGNSDARRRPDHRLRSGRRHRCRWQGGYGGTGARLPRRSALGLACRRSARRQRALPAAISPGSATAVERGAPWLRRRQTSGRRPVILLSNLGEGLDYFVMALAPSLGWLLVGRIVSGATAASVSTAFAYIADVTPPEKRAGRFGMVGAAFGIGFVLGPAIGGL